MRWIWILQDFLYGMFTLIFLIFQVCYIFSTTKQFIKTLKQYNKTSKLDSFQINAFVKYKFLYNQKTVLIKNLLIIAILSFEIVTWSYTIIVQTMFTKTIRNPYVIDRVRFILPNCSVEPSLGYYYHNPASILYNVITGILLCSMITLNSVLTTFLKKRYYTHPLTTSLLRYTGWWGIQVFLLSACCTIYTLPLLPIIFTSLAFINWIYLIYESKQLVYILKSRIRDIVNYEWDRVHYKQSRDAYRMYVVFSIIYIFALLTLIVLISTDLWVNLIQLMLLDECFIKTVYKYKFDLHLSENFIHAVSRRRYNYDTYILPGLLYIPIISLISPYFVNLIWYRLRGCIKMRTTPIRYTPVYEQYDGRYRLILEPHRRKFLCF